MHELRDDMSYRAIVDELIEVPEAADTRDTEAVKRIATAYLKLLFPQVRMRRRHHCPRVQALLPRQGAKDEGYD